MQPTSAQSHWERLELQTSQKSGRKGDNFKGIMIDLTKQ